MSRLLLAAIALNLAIMKVSDPLLFAYWILVCIYWIFNLIDWREK